MLRDDRLGRLLLLDPALERRLQIEHVRPRTTAAMEKPRHHVQAIELLNVPERSGLVTPRPRDHALVVRNAVLCGDELVVPAVVLNELAAMLPESAEVRVDGAQNRGILRIGTL